MTKNKFIYFDVGGVAMTDFSANNGWSYLKKSLSDRETIEEEFDVWWKKEEDSIHIGGEKLDDLVPDLIESLDVSIEKDFSLMKAFIDRFETNEHIWPAIDLASSKANIGLLTNMYTGMFAEIANANLLPKANWAEIVDSSIERVRKPDAAIYEIAQDRANTKPEDIFFIDNLEENLVIPKQMGWSTFLYDPQNQEKSGKELLIKLNEFIETSPIK